MRKKKNSRKYFANRWKDYYIQPDEFFVPHTVEEVIELRGFELKPGTLAVIRAKSKLNGRIKEYAYKQPKSCQKKIQSMLNTHEMTVMTDDVIFNPEFFELYADGFDPD